MAYGKGAGQEMKAGIVKVIVTTVLLVTLVSCTTRYRNHGYIPRQEELAKISVGKDTRDSVLEVIGPPAVLGVLGDTSFYYIESRFRHYAYRAPEEYEREVLVVSFSQSDRVANIERFGLADGQVVVLSRRVTETKGRTDSFLRQLLGNIGASPLGDVLGN
jgi:outer membrane protein assembly factor BamE (lipoprotein component of BamABCDE complex)